MLTIFSLGFTHACEKFRQYLNWANLWISCVFLIARRNMTSLHRLKRTSGRWCGRQGSLYSRLAPWPSWWFNNPRQEQQPGSSRGHDTWRFTLLWTHLRDLLLELLQLFPLLLSLLHQLHGSARLAGSSFVLSHVFILFSRPYNASGEEVTAASRVKESLNSRRFSLRRVVKSL